MTEDAEIDRLRAEAGLLPLNDDKLPGRWTVELVYKRRGIRGHKSLHWPPLDSSMRAEGLNYDRAHRWLERQVRELAGVQGEVIRIHFTPVR